MTFLKNSFGLILIGMIAFILACGSSSSPSTTPSVSSVSKTSVSTTTAGEGSVTFTINFSSAVGEAQDPSVSITTNDADESATIECTFNDARTVLTCTITGMDGCLTLADYTVRIVGETIENATKIFNSADDEFDADNITTCWPDNEGTPAVSDGKLSLTVEASEEQDQRTSIDRYTTISGDFAVVTYLSSNSTITSGTRSFTGLAVNEGDQTDDDSESSIGDGYFSTSGGNFWFLTYKASEGSDSMIASPSSDGDFADLTSQTTFYICAVRKDNQMTWYLSTDGNTYTEVTTDNMECGSNCDTSEDLASIINAAISTSTVQISVTANNQSGEAYTPLYDFVRFKSTGISGSSADCPSL